MKRRAFVWLVMVGATSVAYRARHAIMAPISSWRWVVARRRSLQQELSYLTFEADVLDRFIQDQRQFVSQVEFMPDDVRLLKSTDFFQNGGQESRPLRYVMFFDPYVHPTYNPLRPEA